MGDQIYIGTMDRKVEIYEQITTKNSMGETDKVDTLFKTVWANAKDLSTNENEDGKIYLIQIRNYTIRYNTEIVTRGEEMHIKDVDGTYYISGITSVGRKKYLVLKTIKRE